MADNAESSLEECSLKHYIYEIDVFYKILCKIQENIVKESPPSRKKRKEKKKQITFTLIFWKNTQEKMASLIIRNFCSIENVNEVF